MTTPLYALMSFVFWTVLLVFAIGASRVKMVASGEIAPNGFPSGQPHGGDQYWRLNRAHMNCLENIPLFAAVVLTGHACGLSTGAFAMLAQAYMVARVAQTVIHVSSGSVMAVNARFGCFLAQLGCLLAMATMAVNS